LTTQYTEHITKYTLSTSCSTAEADVPSHTTPLTTQIFCSGKTRGNYSSTVCKSDIVHDACRHSHNFQKIDNCQHMQYFRL